MDSAEFRERNTARSRGSSIPTINEDAARLLLYGLGAAGEAGEVADEIKKWVFHDKPRSDIKILTEIGDVLWYLDRLTKHLGYTLEDAMKCVTDKLNERYPDGWNAAEKHYDHADGL